jgi:sulfatase maturation enzyme AslB (radical SAM superfamily)
MTTKEDTFCVAPFVHQSTKTDGSVKACCRSLPEISNIKDESLIEAWNNDNIKQLRLDLLNGIKNPRCNVCWKLEEANVKSLRQKYNDKEYKARATEVIKSMESDGTVNLPPVWIEFKMSNLCNLKCRMCHPMDSTKWFDDYKKVSHLHNQQWQEYMIKLGLDKKPLLALYTEDFFEKLPIFLQDIKQLDFAGGEPLYDENHYRVLEGVLDNAHNIKLSYASNMSMLKTKKYNVLDYWPKFKRINVGISLDGPPKLNEYIRGGSDSKQIEENIQTLLEYDNIFPIGKITVQALNIYYIPEALEWFREMKLPTTDMHFVTWPEHLDARIWTGEARNKIINKLQHYIDSLKDNSNQIKSTAQNVLNYFSQTETYTDEKWNKFKEWNKVLDESRGESFNDYDFLQEFMND